MGQTMTKTDLEDSTAREKRNGFIRSILQLAAGMEKAAPDTNPWEYKVRAGKLLCEVFQAGEVTSDGTVNSILAHWSKVPYPQDPDWCFVQGFEALCWDWGGQVFGEEKSADGELAAEAHVLRRLAGLLEYKNLE
jgi:hypothetical protein